MTRDTAQGFDLFVQPDLRRKQLTVTLEAPEDAQYTLTIAETGAEHTVSPGTTKLDFNDFQPWTVSSPVLYTLRCAKSGDSEPLGEVRFGMRECTTKEQRFHLNQKPLYLRGVNLDPAEIPADLDGLQTLLSGYKGAGFNLLRVRVDEATTPLLERADDAGLLVFLGLDATAEALSETVQRFRNHASLAAWYVEDGCDETISLIRAADPTRLIFSVSPPQLRRPYRDEPEPVDDLRFSMIVPSERRTELFLQHLGEPQAFSLFTGLGNGEVGCDESEATASPDPTLGDAETLITGAAELRADALGRHVDSVLANPNVAGYCLDADGHPKNLSSIQAPVHPVIRLRRQNLVPRQETRVTVQLVNEARLEGRAELSLQVVGPTNQVLWKKKREINIPRRGKELWSGEIAASGSIGPHRFVVRLFVGGKLQGEGAVPFYVFEPAASWGGEACLLDPQKVWSARCDDLLKEHYFQAPVQIIPPLANTIRAYPENELAQCLGQVKEGAVALFFSPPDDWNELAAQIDEDLRATSFSLVGRTDLVHHARMHPVFDSLPAGSIMDDVYSNVLPTHAFEEEGDREISSCLRVGDDHAIEHVGNNVLVRPYGSGRVVFLHFRVLEHLGSDPVADRLFINLLQHFSRRAVHAGGATPIHQRAVEWIRSERGARVRKWLTVGMFPNWTATGHDTVYPPENEHDVAATYPGWFRAVGWQPWYLVRYDTPWVDLQEATAVGGGRGRLVGPGTAYAYAEFISEARSELSLTVQWIGDAKVWLNDRLVLEERGVSASNERQEAEASVPVKQGRNTVLVKLSSSSDQSGFYLDIGAGDDPTGLRWWG